MTKFYSKNEFEKKYFFYKKNIFKTVFTKNKLENIFLEKNNLRNILFRGEGGNFGYFLI